MCESWLDLFTKKLPIAGYTDVSRRDRADTFNRGGIILYARDFHNCIVHLKDSDTAERSWHTVHTSIGPVLFCLWYRRKLDVDSIETLEQE